MQQRRGTAAQWISTNEGNGPILSPGEIGFESDTNKFKIGDGVNHWIDLDYFTTDSAQAVTDQINAAISGLVDGAPGLLDTLNELASAINDDPTFFTTIATNLSNHESDTTNVHGILDTNELATKEYVTQEIGNSTVDQSALAGVGIDWNGSTEAFDIDSTVATKTYADNAVSTHSSDTTSVHGIADTTELATKAFAASLLTGATKTNITITGDKTGLVISAENGVADSTTTDLAEGTNKYFTDERAQDAVGNSVGTGLTYTDSTGEIKVTPNTYDAYGSASAVSGDLSTHASDTTNIHGIADTSLLATKEYADNAVAAVVDAAPASLNTLKELATALADDANYATTVNNALSLKAPLSSPAFSGTVTGITKSMVGLGSVDNTADTAKPVSDATQTALNLKAPLASPTFTGTVAGITKSMVGLGNVDNTSDSAKPVSTATQSALDLKANAEAPTFTGTVVLPSTTSIGNVSETEIGYLDGVTSGVQSQINLKAPIANPTFTGTVILPTGTVTSGMILDGTIVDADINASAAIAQSKVSGLTSDLDLKAPLASPALTGTPTAPTAAAGTNTTQVATTAFVGTAVADLVASAPSTLNTLNELATALGNDASFSTTVTNSIATKAPINNPTFTGTVAGISNSMVGLANVDNTSDVSKPISNATQTALDLKANLAGPTFTGTVVLPGTTSIGNVSATELGFVDGVTSAIQTQLDAKIAKSDISAKGAILVGTGSGTYAAQAVGANGQVLTANSAQADGVEWTTIAGYSEPTIGSTSIASGATVSTVEQLTLNNPTLTGTATLPVSTQLVTSAPALYAAGLNKAYFVKSYDGITWAQISNPGFCYNSLVNMNGILAAIGTTSNSVATTSGIIYSSNNGSTWQTPTLTSSDVWYGGGYINNKYVVVGRSNAPYSTDLITWTNVTMPDVGSAGGVENYWVNVEEVNGRIYTYRLTNGAYTTNGTTWTEITYPFAVNDIVYANNKYTITGTNAVASSTDGITNWVTQSMPSNGSWGPIEYANGTYVVFKQSSTAAAYSTDAITWTEVSYGSVGYSFDDIEYINERFIALPSSSADIVYSSTNGVTWTSYAKGLAVGEGFNSLLTITETTSVSGRELGSLDGITSPVQSQLNAKASLASPTFTGTVTLPTGTVTSAMISDNTIVNADISSSAAIAQSKIANLTTDLAAKSSSSNFFISVSGTNTSVAASSTDGITWNQRTMPATGNWIGAAYGMGLFVAVSRGSVNAASSTDGITWNQRTMPSNVNWNTLFYGNGIFVSTADGSTTAAYSTNGITWTTTTMPTSVKWSKGIYANNKFVILRDENEGYNHNNLALSTNGTTWTLGTMPSTGRWSSLTYGKGIFLAVARYGGAAYSTDAISWTTSTLSQTTSWKSATFGNNKFLVVANSNGTGPTNVSTDGITWTEGTLPSNTWAWTNTSFVNGIFHVWSYSQFADQTSIATSTDGTTWTLRSFPVSSKWGDVASVPSYITNTTGVVGTAQQPISNTSYTVSLNDKFLTFNTASLSTITLPDPSAFPGRELVIKQLGAGSIASASSNVTLLNSQIPQTLILSGSNKYVTLVSDGYNWIIYISSLDGPTLHTVFGML